MSEYIFHISIPAQSATSNTPVQQLATLALILGCDPDVGVGGAIYPFNQDGINVVSIHHLAVLLQLEAAGAISCSGFVGPRFVEMTGAEYHDLVPIDFPESAKHVDDQIQQMTWDEYCPWATQSADGSQWLVNMSERAEGETCGDGLSWDEFKVWFGKFGMAILSSDQAQILLETYANSD